MFLFVRKAGFSWQTCAVNPQQEYELKKLVVQKFPDGKNGLLVLNLNISENNSKYDLANILMLVGARFG